MNKPTPISQHILQAHCQSLTSQRYIQSFVKELAKPKHNRLTTKTEEEHRTDNSTYKKLAVQWLIEALCFVSSFVVADSLCFEIANFL
jgi:hypothetical protein